MPFSYYLYKLLKPWFKAKLRLMMAFSVGSSVLLTKQLLQTAPWSQTWSWQCGTVGAHAASDLVMLPAPIQQPSFRHSTMARHEEEG